jgi:hypothetical protein
MRRLKPSTQPSFLHDVYKHRTVAWFFILAALMFVGAACSPSSNTNLVTKKNMTLDQALAITPRDDRPEILQQMGPPDAFRLTFETLNDQAVRYEEWSYFDDQTSLVFVDGTLTSTVSIEPLPDGSIYASYYDPQSFQEGMTSGGVKSLLADQELFEVSTDEIGQPGGLILAGRQILFGFDQDQLVYVETLALTPEEAQ